MMYLDIYHDNCFQICGPRVARMSSVAAPDGGFWGWMAVFACFMGNLIGDGVMYSFGVFLPKFKEYFNCGSGETSTINALQMGVTFASGCVLSMLSSAVDNPSVSYGTITIRHYI